MYARIQDDEMGISKMNLSKIFDPFFTTKEIDKSTGLVFQLVIVLLKNMGAKLKFRRLTAVVQHL